MVSIKFPFKRYIERSINLRSKSPYLVHIQENTDQRRFRILTLFTQWDTWLPNHLSHKGKFHLHKFFHIQISVQHQQLPKPIIIVIPWFKWFFIIVKYQKLSLFYIIVSFRPILWPWAHKSYKWKSTKLWCHYKDLYYVIIKIVLFHGMLVNKDSTSRLEICCWTFSSLFTHYESYLDQTYKKLFNLFGLHIIIFESWKFKRNFKKE